MFIGAVVCMNTHTSRWRMHFQPRVMGLLLRTRAEGQCWCSSSAFITRDFLIQTLIIFQNTIQSLTSSQGCLKGISSGALEKLFRCQIVQMFNGQILQTNEHILKTLLSSPPAIARCFTEHLFCAQKCVFRKSTSLWMGQRRMGRTVWSHLTRSEKNIQVLMF